MYPPKELLNELIEQAPKAAAELEYPDPLSYKPNNLALMKWYQKQVIWAEQQIDSLEKQFGVSASCYNGCSACCRQMIWTTRAELDILKVYIQTLDQSVIKEIYDRALVSSAILEKELGSTTVARMTFNSREMQEQYYNLNLKCPLLNTEGSCTVHPVRPSNCWAFRSYGDPRECTDNLAPSMAVHYKDLEIKVIVDNLYAVKAPKSEITLLPAALAAILKELV